MVEWAGLENRNTRKCIEGSNPSLSATFIRLAAAFLVLTSMPPALASSQELTADMEAFVVEMVKKHQFDRDALRSLFGKARSRPEILRAISAPGTARPWHEFRRRNVDPARIAGGAAFWRRHASDLARAKREYGVPEEIIVATIGVETVYGRNTGGFRVLDSLATLAFHYPPRATLFRRQLEEYLLLVREAGFDPTALRGSYAGAIGIPQFLPGSYRRYAVDFDGDGKRDLMSNTADAIGSVANYYRAHGWVPGQAVVAPAAARGENIETLLDMGIKPKLTVGEMKSRGVTPVVPADDAAPAALFAVQSRDGPRYYLGFTNFYVITRYNRSINYALAVHELAREIRAAFGAGT